MREDRWMSWQRRISAILTLGLLGVGVWLWRHPIVGAAMRDQWRLLTDREALTPWMLARASGTPRHFRLRLQEYAQQRPLDWQIALALPSDSLTPETPLELERLRRFESLVARYPDRPEFPATALRLSCQSPRKPLRPEAWAKIATHGRQVDPDNAFFDQMYAWYLHKQGREAEAWQALMEGARKNRWEDYVMVEVKALNALQESLGEPKAFVTALHELALLYPHYSVLRQQARDAVAYAQKLKAAGRRAEANRLLQAQARLGALMAAYGHTIIAILAGDAIVKTAAKGASDPATRAWIGMRSAELENAVAFLKTKRIEDDIEQVYRHANTTLPPYRNALLWLGFSLLALTSVLILLLGAGSRSITTFVVLVTVALIVSLLLLGSMRASPLGTALDGVEPIPQELYESLTSKRAAPLQDWADRLLSFLGLDRRLRSLFASLAPMWVLAFGTACAYGTWRSARRGVSALAETRQVLLWLFCIACTAYYINLWNYAHLNHAAYQQLRELVDNQPRYYWRKAGVQPPPIPPLP